MKNPLSEMLEEIATEHPDGTRLILFFKGGHIFEGAFRAARRKKGDRIDGLYELTAQMGAKDPSTGRDKAVLVSHFFAADHVDRIGVPVEAPLVVQPKSIVIPT